MAAIVVSPGVRIVSLAGKLTSKSKVALILTALIVCLMWIRDELEKVNLYVDIGCAPVAAMILCSACLWI